MLISKTKYDNPVLAFDGEKTWFEFYEEEYECNSCGEYVHESFPHHADEENDFHLCWDCAFLKGKISSKEYMKYTGGLDNFFDAYIYNDEITFVKKGRKPPWETKTETRYNADYTDWRTEVFERDNYECQKCEQVGGNLNAHHIKPYADYPKLRLDLDNGITLCVKCHKEEHWGD